MIVDKRTKSLVVSTDQPELIMQMMPGESRLVTHRGERMVQVKHTLRNAKLLCNAGHEAPSPVRYYYNFPHPPWIEEIYEHQIETAEFCTLNKRCHVLNEMGTMKTSSVLFAADYLMRIGRVSKAVVVAPLSTLESVWSKEVFTFLMHRQCAILHGTMERRLALLDGDYDFYIVNYRGAELLEDALRERPDINLYIIDEAAKLRSTKSNLWETLQRLTNPQQHPKMWYWHLTGTPTPKAPTDAWGQARLVNPKLVPKYYSHFRSQTMYQTSVFRWVRRPGSHKIVHAALQPAIRIRKKDCLKLPPVVMEPRMVPLSTEQKRLFKEMKNDMVAEMKSGVRITAAMAGDRVSKLRQICAGVVKDTATGKFHVIDHKPRLDALLEFIENASAKVIVVTPYKGVARVLTKEVGEHYSCELVNGDVSITQRNKIFSAFKLDADPHVLLCHPMVMAHGLTLTEADTLVFYGPISSELAQQVTERINRAGQTRPMTIGRLGAHPVEWDYYQMVDAEGAHQLSVLDLFNRELKRVGV